MCKILPLYPFWSTSWDAMLIPNPFVATSGKKNSPPIRWTIFGRSPLLAPWYMYTAPIFSFSYGAPMATSRKNVSIIQMLCKFLFYQGQISSIFFGERGQEGSKSGWSSSMVCIIIFFSTILEGKLPPFSPKWYSSVLFNIFTIGFKKKHYWARE